MTVCDVVVLGGGPAGSVCAARLAARGRHVILLERERHPRFHLGESLLPMSLEVLDAIGVLGAMRGRFLVKRGARFLDGRDENRSVRYAFADAFRPRWDSAFQVPRDEFDELLFRHAGTRGAELREGWQALRVVYEAGRAVGVEVRSPDGSPVALGARFVVDATGRDAMIARGAGSIERIAGLDHTALFTQVRGAFREPGEREGDIQIVLFGQGQGRGWFWLIPFADGRTSAGAVVSPAFVRAHAVHEEQGAQGAPGGERGAAALFEAALAQAPVVRRMLGLSERLFAPRATADFSFRVRALTGPGWLALGDAAGFIDPLFSTGAHLAMSGALAAADALDAALSLDDPRHASFESWERDQRAGAELFVGVVQAFYSGELEPYLFSEPQHPFLHRAITSMLSGDVFAQDAVWARDMRKRFPSAC